MNTTKTLAIAITSLTLFACNAQEKNITVKQLPAKAQMFIQTNFPNQATSYIIEDKDLTKTEYEVRFTGGAEVEFDGQGNWKEVDANKTLMPAGVIPTKITAYISQHYKGKQVEKIEQKARGYKLEFTDGLELKFDPSGNFIKIDD